MKHIDRFVCSLFCVIFLSSTLLFAQATQKAPVSSAGTEASELVKQARQLNNDGKQNDALDLYSKALKIASGKDLYDAHVGIGNALDLLGRYDEARKYLSKAIEVAPPESKI